VPTLEYRSQVPFGVESGSRGQFATRPRRLFYPSLVQRFCRNRSPIMIGRSQARSPLCTVAGVAFTLRAAAGISRPPPQLRQAAPIPAVQIKIAAFASVGLLAFGAILAWLWNRWNAREPRSAGKMRRDNPS
jgi:hypothetical protein